MKKIIITILMFILPIMVNAAEVTYVEENECDKTIDKNDFKKEIKFIKDKKDDSLLKKYPELFYEVGTREEYIETDKLIYISFRNIVLKNSPQIKINSLILEIDGKEVLFNTDGCKNCSNNGHWISNKKNLYLYNNSEFKIVSYKEFKYDELKIKLDIEGEENIESFELVYSPIRNFDAYKMHVNSNNNLNELIMDKYYYFDNTQDVEAHYYYKKLYKCYEEENDETPTTGNSSNTSFTPISLNKKESNIVLNQNKEKNELENKAKEKTKVKEKSKVKAVKLKNENSQKIDLTRQNKKGINYTLIKDNKYLLYYLISLLFFIPLFIIFVINVKKCRAK